MELESIPALTPRSLLVRILARRGVGIADLIAFEALETEDRSRFFSLAVIAWAGIFNSRSPATRVIERPRFLASAYALEALALDTGCTLNALARAGVSVLAGVPLPALGPVGHELLRVTLAEPTVILTREMLAVLPVDDRAGFVARLRAHRRALASSQAAKR